MLSKFIALVIDLAHLRYRQVLRTDTLENALGAARVIIERGLSVLGFMSSECDPSQFNVQIEADPETFHVHVRPIMLVGRDVCYGSFGTVHLASCEGSVGMGDCRMLAEIALAKALESAYLSADMACGMCMGDEPIVLPVDANLGQTVAMSFAEDPIDYYQIQGWCGKVAPAPAPAPAPEPEPAPAPEPEPEPVTPFKHGDRVCYNDASHTGAFDPESTDGRDCADLVDRVDSDYVYYQTTENCRGGFDRRDVLQLWKPKTGDLVVVTATAAELASISSGAQRGETYRCDTISGDGDVSLEGVGLGPWVAVRHIRPATLTEREAFRAPKATEPVSVKVGDRVCLRPEQDYGLLHHGVSYEVIGVLQDADEPALEALITVRLPSYSLAPQEGRTTCTLCAFRLQHATVIK